MYVRPETAEVQMDAMNMLASSPDGITSNLDDTLFGGSAAGQGVSGADANRNGGWELW